MGFSKIPTVVRLSEEQLAKLKAFASMDECSISDIIRTALDEFLEDYEVVRKKQAELNKKG